MLHLLTRRELARETVKAETRLDRVQTETTDWCVRSDWRDCLWGEGAPDWFHVTPDPSCTLVKKGRRRSVWQIHLQRGTLFAKLVSTPGFWGKLGLYFRGTPAEREWRACRHAERLGVAVPASLAVGVQRGNEHRSLFLAEFLEGSIPGAEYWRRQVVDQDHTHRRSGAASVIETLARLFASAHERGFLHRDGHPNNVLLQSLPDGRKHAFFVDIYGAGFTRGCISMKQAVRSLAQLDQFFHRTATSAERLRFLSEYLENRPSLGDDRAHAASVRRWSRQVLHARRRLSARLARQRDRRLRRKGPYFSTLRLDSGWSARVVLKLERRHLFPEPAVSDRTIAEWRSLLNGLLATANTDGGGPAPLHDSGLCVESTQYSRWIDRAYTRLRGSRHQRLFEQCHKWRHRDCHAPLILGWAWHRAGALIDQTILIRPSAIGNGNIVQH